jgi:adenosine kinase
MTIVCTGSIAYDYLMSFPGYFRDHILPDRLDTISLSFLVDSMVKQRGGTAPNIAYTLALLGESPMVVGTAGEDFEDYRKFLDQHGVDTTYIKSIPGKFTASFFANTDMANAQIASFYTGAMADAGSVSLRDIPRKKAELVTISPNDPNAMRQYCEECQDLGIPYLYDPSQQIVRVDPEDIRIGVLGCESLFVNDYEYQLLQKHTGLSHKTILEKVKFLVVTLGADGALVYANEKEYKIPIIPTGSIIDPTGVGDAFRGGFIRGYRLGLDWQTCGQMGSLAAAYCLEQRGTQNHCYTPQEFVERYRTNFDDMGVLGALL